ncbi:branched-chain amino acid ABC transporter permease [Treponema pectinovorum]|uniref:branched-chain amino acid ABC transporter permease n=1 Tax=Treponema pectinovorum TaxID=164 RepID=UPI0011CB2431|nr:branched-chain amino acid ABC transporter permease [Treponema pectinovorum]
MNTKIENKLKNTDISKRKNLISLFCLLAFIFILIVVLEAILPKTSILFTVLKKGAIYSLVAVSMNLLNGFTGLFSLGQAGFMLLGAYTYGIFTIPVEARAQVYQYFNGGLIQFTLPVPVALILSGLVACAFAYLIALPVLHLKSDYLAIATLGFAEIIRAIFQWDKLGAITNGSNLLRKYPVFQTCIFYFALSALCIALIVLLLNSTYGRAFIAVRDDEIAAEAMGINLSKTKQLSFVISSFFAGISGAMLAMFQTTIQASQFKSSLTYEILLIVVIGGMGSITGSCISSFLFIACSEWWLRFLDRTFTIGSFTVPLLRPGFRKVVFSIAIMCIVLYWQRGIMGDKEFNIKSIIKFFNSLSHAKKSKKSLEQTDGK